MVSGKRDVETGLVLCEHHNFVWFVKEYCMMNSGQIQVSKLLLRFSRRQREGRLWDSLCPPMVSHSPPQCVLLCKRRHSNGTLTAPIFSVILLYLKSFQLSSYLHQNNWCSCSLDKGKHFSTNLSPIINEDMLSLVCSSFALIPWFQHN